MRYTLLVFTMLLLGVSTAHAAKKVTAINRCECGTCVCMPCECKNDTVKFASFRLVVKPLSRCKYDYSLPKWVKAHDAQVFVIFVKKHGCWIHVKTVKTKAAVKALVRGYYLNGTKVRVFFGRAR